MRIVDDERVAKFVGERVGRIIFPPFTSIGIERDGEIVGGAVFNCFTGNDIHVTIAGTGFTKGFLAEVGDYVFAKLGCGRLTAITEQPSVVRIAERLGGQVEGLMRDHFGQDQPAYVIGILKSEYRY